jgi:cystathionine gamma-synthase
MSSANGEPNGVAPTSQLSLSTLAIHSDDVLNVVPDVAPAMHVSTTFRYSKEPEKLFPVVADTDTV